MGYESDFSPDGKLFSLLDSDGRLLICDIQTNEITKHDPNPNSRYTCFIWFKNCRKNLRHCKTKKNNADTLMCMALGTNQGRIDVYCHATEKVYNFLNDKVHQSVTSLCWHNNALYTSDESGRVFEWSLKETQPGLIVRYWQMATGIPKLIVSLPISNGLLIGCEKLEYWSMDDYDFKFTIADDLVDAKSMKIIRMTDRAQEYVLTTATTKPAIYLWKVQTKTNKLTATFSTPSKATFVDCFIIGKGLIIAAIGDALATASGKVVHLFNVDDIRNRRMTTVAVDQGAVSLHIGSADSENITIRYGNSPTKLSFKNLNENRLDVRKLIGFLTLRNDDANLRRFVFSNKHDEVEIRSTLTQLPTQYIPRLIDQLIEFTQKLKSVQITVRWLKLLLEIHTKEPTTDELRDRFGLLLAVIENRFSSYVPMAKLKGRLDFVLNQKQWSNCDTDNHQESLIIHEGDGQMQYKSNYFITE